MSSVRRSLQTKIIIWSFLPALVILLAVSLATFIAYQRVTQTLALERDRELTRLAAGQLAVQINPYLQELDALARTAGINRGETSDQQDALRAARSRLVVFDNGAVLLDQRGRVVAAEPDRLDLVGEDWSTRTYFRQIVAGSGAVFSNILADGPGGSEVIAAAVPIIGGQGEFRGVLVGMFGVGNTAVSAFYGSVVKLQAAGSANAMLVDGAGRVIYDGNFARIGRDASAEPAVQQVMEGGSDAIPARSPDGASMIAGFAPVPGTPWGLIVWQEAGALTGAFRDFGQFLIVLLVMGVLVPAAVVTASARRITRPINELITASQEVARGNFSQIIVADTGDEIEELAQQFNTMSAQLRASYTQLEQQVAERSKALAVLNDMAALVNRSIDLQEMLDDALAEVLAAMQIDAGGVYLLDNDQQLLQLAAERGLGAGMRERLQALHVGEGFSGQAAASGQPVVLDEVPRQALVERFGLSEADFRTAASFPLVSSGETLGALFVTNRSPRPFTAQDIELLTSIALQMGVAIENTRLLSRQTEAAALEERQRLARELHDAVTQTLFSASLIAEVLPRIWERNPDEARRRLEELRQLARGALAEMRTLLMELRPSALIEAPLGDLLRQLSEACAVRVRTPIIVSLDTIGCDPPSEIKVAMYRIAQEALNNAARHSGANQVWLNLHCTADRAILAVRDNGVGFDPARVPSNHLGLNIMRERAQAIGATLSVNSEPGEGAEVIVMWSPDAP